jgi:ferredoxin
MLWNQHQNLPKNRFTVRNRPKKWRWVQMQFWWQLKRSVYVSCHLCLEICFYRAFLQEHLNRLRESRLTCAAVILTAQNNSQPSWYWMIANVKCFSLELHMNDWMLMDTMSCMHGWIDDSLCVCVVRTMRREWIDGSHRWVASTFFLRWVHFFWIKSLIDR